MERAIPIAPMSVGRVVDAGMNLARRHYRRLVILGAWGALPAALVSAFSNALQGPSNARNFDNAGTLAAIPLGILSFLAVILAEGAITIAVARIVEGAENLDSLSLYRTALGRFLPLIGSLLIFFFIAIPALIIVPLGIWLIIRWSLSWCAIFLERAGPITALKRSWALTRRAFWHTLGVLLVGSIIYGILGMIVGVVGVVISGVITVVAGNFVATVLALSIVNIVLQVLLMPLAIAYYVVLYFELRARTEGYDLIQRAAQANPGP